MVRFDKKPDIPNTGWTKWADAYIKDHNDPTGRKGYSQSHFDLTGKVIAVGTKAQPIAFTSAQSEPEYADWDQLILFGGSRLEYVDLAYARNGANIAGKNTSIRYSKIHNSLWSCIDIFSVQNTIENNEIYHCWHQAVGVKVRGDNIIRNNDIHDAQLAVNCENNANPIITDNRIAAAPIGPECSPGAGNTETTRDSDTVGGTYNGKVIYPSIRP